MRVINQPNRSRSYFAPVGMVAGLVLVAALCLPAIDRGGASRRSQCKNNLKQIGLALHNYHDEFGCFPPAFIADANGRPMHSWRVLLLPYLDQAPLYVQYRFDEPWDGPNNRKLADKILPIFNCPSEVHGDGKSAATMTSYVAVVGPETAWPGNTATSIRDIKDGTSNTLLIVEVANSRIHWMEPRDLHVVQMAPTINAKFGQGISSLHTGGAHALLADGSVRFISEQTTAELIRALLTVHGKEKIGDF
ncbi:MAG TPA: DUF1559 domain-containing protein [Planctomycetaceae bacterium]